VRFAQYFSLFMQLSRSLVVGAVVWIGFPAIAPCGNIVDLVFEGNNIDNEPNWSLLRDPSNPNAVPRATVGPTGRTFQTGSNGDALFITPYGPTTETFFEGAVWQVDSAQAVDVPATSVVFVQTETFSDVASNFSQWYKVDVSLGIQGNGRSTEGGFQSDDPNLKLGETHLTTNTNYSTDPAGVNQQKVQLEGQSLNSDFKFSNTNWDGRATTALLDQTYLNRFTFRQQFGSDAITPIGSRVEVNGALRDDASPALIGAAGGPAARFMPTKVDRVTVQLLRHEQAPRGSTDNVREFDALPPA